MAKGFKHGAGGGAGLNFKVVGNPQPENPRENTIWVNTDTEITGWVFRATEPEAPEEGMVCFITNQASLTSFNALKKNGIQVFPFICYQYVSGEWVLKDTEIYQNGAWNPIVSDLWLYNAGDECTDVTGGWEVYKGHRGGTGEVAPIAKREEGSITLTTDVPGATSYVSGTLRAVNKIDLSKYSKLVFDGVLSNVQYGSAGFFIWSEVSDDWGKNVVATIGSAFSGVQTLDISGLDGEFYIGVGAHHGGSYAKINSIKLIV